MNRIENAAALEQLRTKAQEERKNIEVLVAICGGTGCETSGSTTLRAALEAKLKEKGLTNVTLKRTGCHGFCEQGPLVHIEPADILYTNVKDSDVDEIVEETLIGNKVIDRLLYKDPASGDAIQGEKDIQFYAKQTRVILDNNRRIDPASIEDYIALDGYAALAKALTMEPSAIVDEVSKSKIRGRGGGGFATGRKWASAAKVEADERFVICNGDEGDPGAYMDRSVLEGNPHLVLEGMILGGFAIGATEGYIYVRAEYPLAVQNLEIAIGQAKEAGLLGKNILGSGFDFEIFIYRGAGAFVCGESSALIKSIEGNVGEPRAKHIHATEAGLWGKPTVLNNVETWANIPHIVGKGADWFLGIGTEGSKGTKIFSLVGKINNTGLVEVPMGTTLRELIFDIGGGIPDGKEFKAVQTGGPSGGCIPADKLDTPIDFDELTKLGSMMGSGGMIVMDEENCMVDIARYYTAFNLDESCGKCTSCREGTERMLDILQAICGGEAKPEDIDLLKELAHVVKTASLCGLGKTAPNPTETTLQYFMDEYMEHIDKGVCRAKVCKALIKFSIEDDPCVGCGACAKRCPVDAITGELKKTHVIDAEKCIKCGACKEACKFGAVVVTTGGGE